MSVSGGHYQNSKTSLTRALSTNAKEKFCAFITVDFYRRLPVDIPKETLLSYLQWPKETEVRFLSSGRELGPQASYYVQLLT